MILAMDISLSSPGFALLTKREDKFEVVDTLRVRTSGKNYRSRLLKIGNELQSFLFYNLTHQIEPIETVVMERGFCRYNTATQAVFLAVGAVELTLGRVNVPLTEKIAPKSIKQAITGSGQASKEEVAEGVRHFLVSAQRDIVFESDDVSDALACGITYYLLEGE